MIFRQKRIYIVEFIYMGSRSFSVFSKDREEGIGGQNNPVPWLGVLGSQAYDDGHFGLENLAAGNRLPPTKQAGSNNHYLELEVGMGLGINNTAQFTIFPGNFSHRPGISFNLGISSFLEKKGG